MGAVLVVPDDVAGQLLSHPVESERHENASSALCPHRPDEPLDHRDAGIRTARAYQFGPDFYAPNAAVRFRIRDGHLFNGSDWAIPAGDMKFVHRIYWSDLEFKRDATGEVDRLRYDDFVGTRIR